MCVCVCGGGGRREIVFEKSVEQGQNYIDLLSVCEWKKKGVGGGWD